MMMMMMVSTIVLVVLSCGVLTSAQTFNAVSFTLPSPPMLVGALEPNYALYNAERLHSNRVRGPRSFAFLNGNVYAVTVDGKVVNIAACVPQIIASLSLPGCRGRQQCGLLTSIRADNTGMLLVLDAYRGLFRVNPATGAVQQLYSSATPVNGRAPRYLNGLVQAPDGTVFMTDSSDNFDAVNDIYIIMEGRPSGRLLALNPTTGQISEVLKDAFVYPNGLEISADGTRLLVAESGRARVLSVGLTSQNFLQVTVFAQNLPGLPGNIRRSSRGTFWVGLSLIRHAGISNSMDLFSSNPALRTRTVYRVNRDTIRSYYPKYGLVVELDQNGRVVGSLHDPTGRVDSSVDEAAEVEGLLYIGSSTNAFTGRIVLPQGDGRVVTVDSVIQVLRSRCQIPENKLAQAKAVLTEYLRQQTQGTGGTTGGQTSGGATTGTPSTAAPPSA